MKRLRLSVCDDTGFRLHLATYDQPKRRDELIARVVKEGEAKKVRVTRLDLTETGPETNLVGLLRQHIQETDLPPGWRQAVMVTGIEQRLDYSGDDEGLAFLHHANLLRDALPEAAPVPVVLWLSRLASAALPGAAPDLWHWRATNFDFTGDEAPRAELLREMTTLRTEREDFGRSGEQRRARIRMLADLLTELEREGPPKSKRQAAERADLLNELGLEKWELGLAAEAIPRFEHALDLYREIDDRRGEGYGLGNLGLAYDALGKLHRAIEHFEQQLVIAREIGDRRAQGYALGNLGTAYGELGEARRAIEHFEQQLVIAREIGDRRGEGNALGNLGSAYQILGEVRRAVEHYEQVLVVTREIGDRQGEGATLGNLGVVCAGLGEVRRAIEHYEQALAIAREIGDRRGEAYALSNGALAFDQLGERAKAIEWLTGALTIAKNIEDPTVEQIRARLAEWEAG